MDRSQPVESWNLQALAQKVGQYCTKLQGLSAAQLGEAAKGGDFEALRDFLHQKGEQAYNEKVLPSMELLTHADMLCACNVGRQQAVVAAATCSL